MSSIAARSFGAVEPSDYLELANEWAQSDNPAVLRTAVDRAYYAAFLTVRDQLAAKGYGEFAASSRAHGQVGDALSEVRSQHGEMLRILRRARNRLTYETDATRLPRRQTRQELLDSSRAIIAAVEALPEFSGELPG